MPTRRQPIGRSSHPGADDIAKFHVAVINYRNAVRGALLPLSAVVTLFFIHVQKIMMIHLRLLNLEWEILH